MRGILNLTMCICTLIQLIRLTRAEHPDGTIKLEQGIVVGLKIFPEASRLTVYSYLGIPYGQALRFSPAEKHPGWGNRTLMAREYKPICPQLQNYAFDELHNGYTPYTTQTNEDCLFLNIWTSQSAFRFGNHSVLVIITGEEQAFDWSQNRPNGLDIATEHIVVVTIQSRTNVFGWLTLHKQEAPGNLGLRDQRLAFEWINDNIHKFGGDRRQITLLGHGTSGATNAMLHLTNAETAAFFARYILMSGTVYSPYSYQHSNRTNANDQRQRDTENDLSLRIVKKLACDSAHVKYVLDCLRQKSVADVLKAFEHVYEHGNYTELLGPQIDTYLPKSMQYLSADPKLALELGEYPNVPMLIGICSNEGASIQDLWLELAREGYDSLIKYIKTTILPNILSHYGFSSSPIEQVQKMISWRFFDRMPQASTYLLNAMQRLLSETKYETPFFETIERLTANTSSPIFAKEMNKEIFSASAQQRRAQKTIYVYAFHQSKSMDIRGAINYFGGASHSSDLLVLMGPSLYQQISRRRLTASEMRLCKKIRHLFVEFIKTGTPTPGRVFDGWHPYTAKYKYIQLLGDATLDGDAPIHLPNANAEDAIFVSELEKNSAEIANMINGQARIASTNSLNPYRIGTEQFQNDPNDSARMRKSYLGAYETSEYYNILTKIHSFWSDLLPKIDTLYVNQTINDIFARANLKENPLYIAAIATQSNYKFKHAFFSMLMLVCLLLTVLAICVYILKKNQRPNGISLL